MVKMVEVFGFLRMKLRREQRIDSNGKGEEWGREPFGLFG